MMTMRCPEIQEKLSAFYDGALRETERAAMEAHLRECAECQREWTWLQTTSRLLQAWDAPKVRPRVQAEFMAKLEERAARQPWWATLFAGWQKQAAWATAAAAVLIVMVFSIKRPILQINDAREKDERVYTTERSGGLEKSNPSDRLTMNVLKDLPAPKRSAVRTEKGAPPLRKLDKAMATKTQPAPTVTRQFRALPAGVSAEADRSLTLDEAGGMLSKEGNALLVLNVAPQPATEAANYVRTIVAEVAEPLTGEFMDVPVPLSVGKRPERMLTDWMTETGD